ncbi:MAG: hypothetical protein OCD01_20260 [Fibrobacterales bacterium]
MKTFNLLSVLLFLFFLFYPVFLIAQDNWTMHNILWGEDDLISVDYENDHFIARGKLKTSLVSKDGKTWGMVPSGDSIALVQPIKIGEHYYNPWSHSVSDDMINWVFLGYFSYFTNTKTIDNKLYMVGSKSLIMSSWDAHYWEKHTVSNVGDLNSVQKCGNAIYAVGDSSTIVVSFNGKKWQKVDAAYRDKDDLEAYELRDATFNDIACNDSTMVIVGENSSSYSDKGIVLTSKDGVEWDWVFNTREPLNSVTHKGDVFIGVGDKGTVVYSDNIDSWELFINKNIKDPITEIFVDGDTTIALRRLGGHLYSTDGIEWKSTAATKYEKIWGYTQFQKIDSLYFGVNERGMEVLDSTFERIKKPEYLKNRSVGEQMIQFVGSNVIKINENYVRFGKFHLDQFGFDYSIDGYNWRNTELDFDSRMESVSVAYNGKDYSMVDCLEGYHSTDGVAWSKVFSGGMDDGVGCLTKVIWVDTVFAAISTEDTRAPGFALSKNGIDWEFDEFMINGKRSYFKASDLVWTGKQFVATSINGEIISSKDGKDWQVRASDIFLGTRIEKLVWNGTYFIVVSGGALATSLEDLDVISSESLDIYGKNINPIDTLNWEDIPTIYDPDMLLIGNTWVYEYNLSIFGSTILDNGQSVNPTEDKTKSILTYSLVDTVTTNDSLYFKFNYKMEDVTSYRSSTMGGVRDENYIPFVEFELDTMQITVWFKVDKNDSLALEGFPYLLQGQYFEDGIYSKPIFEDGPYIYPVRESKIMNSMSRYPDDYSDKTHLFMGKEGEVMHYKNFGMLYQHSSEYGNVDLIEFYNVNDYGGTYISSFVWADSTTEHLNQKQNYFNKDSTGLPKAESDLAADSTSNTNAKDSTANSEIIDSTDTIEQNIISDSTQVDELSERHSKDSVPDTGISSIHTLYQSKGRTTVLGTFYHVKGRSEEWNAIHSESLDQNSMVVSINGSCYNYSKELMSSLPSGVYSIVALDKPQLIQ